MNARSNIWKKASQWLVLLIFVIVASGCGPTTEPEEPTESPVPLPVTEEAPTPIVGNCENALALPEHISIEPETDLGYIKNHIVLIGQGGDSEENPVDEIAEVVNMTGVDMYMVWDISNILPDFPDSFYGYTIRLYEWQTDQDALYVVKVANKIALDNDLEVVSEPDSISKNDTEGEPASGNGGIGGGGLGRLYENPNIHDNHFSTQWVLLGGNPGGINLGSINTSTGQFNYYWENMRGTGVNVVIYDTLSLPFSVTNVYTITDGTDANLCVTAFVSDLLGGLATPTAVNYGDSATHHGPGIDGLVREVAPGVDDHLVQTMTLNGNLGIPTGDLTTLIYTMSQILVKYPGEKNIHNLSLVFLLNDPEFVKTLLADPTHPDSQAAYDSIFDIIDRNDNFQTLGLPIRNPDDPIFPLVALGVFLHYVSERNNQLIVAAAGNYGNGTSPPPPMMPASLPSVLGVGSSNYDGEPSCFSNDPGDGGVWAPSGDGFDNGDHRCVPDPGVQITDDPESHCDEMELGCQHAIIIPYYVGDPGYPNVTDISYAYWQGTSFSTPLVSGLAALIWGYDYSLSPDEVKGLIYRCQTNDVIDVRRTLNALSTLDDGEQIDDLSQGAIDCPQLSE